MRKKRLLNGAAHGVGAQQHAKLVVAQMLLKFYALYLLRDKVRLVVFVLRIKNLNGLASTVS
jgi:hypothetical protein